METHLLHSHVNPTIHSQPASTNAPLSSISEISPEQPDRAVSDGLINNRAGPQPMLTVFEATAQQEPRLMLTQEEDVEVHALNRPGNHWSD